MIDTLVIATDNLLVIDMDSIGPSINSVANQPLVSPMQLLSLFTLLALSTGAMASASTRELVASLNVDAATCNAGLREIISTCEECAYSGLECLGSPGSRSSVCGGKTSDHAKNCHGCIDEIVAFLTK